MKLVHSRFIAVDRMSNDAELLRLLGPDPGARPDKLVVVGTQVIEQSLDIDFDVMVTDVAPVDLLLQRMGRLHRHQRGVGQSQRPRKLRQARCFIAGVEDWDEIPPKFAKGVDSVYPRSLLWRSLLALKAGADVSCMTTVNLPHDIATLVELVYSSGDMCEAPAIAAVAQGWEDALHTEDKKLVQGRVASQIRAGDWLLGKPQTGNGSSLIGWLRDSYSSLDDARGRAAVRDTDESIEVIVVQECKQGFELLPWVTDGHGGRPLGGYLGDGSVSPDDEVARLAANCTVSLPPRLSASWVYASVIKALEMQAQIPGWQASRWLQGQLALVLDSSLGTTIETDSYVFRLRYSREAGLELIAAEKKGEDEK